MFRGQIKKEIQSIVGDGVNFSVEVPENPEHGDYASNVALILAKKEGKNPKETAEEFKTKLLNGAAAKFVERIDIAGPGFLNFWISRSALLASLQSILKNNNPIPKDFEKVGKGKKVIVEYFQLNIAKRPHIGHIRSAVIGDALKRMLLSQGYDAISDTHVGDWGTQFGILLLEYKDLEPHMRREVFSGGDPFEKLENMYISGNENITREATRLDRAKEEFAKLEHGDAENRKLWQEMIDLSMRKLLDSAARLGLAPFEEHKGESSYEKVMPGIAEEALNKGVAQKKDDGAVIVDLTDENLDEAVLIKSDGASTYLLRDLATIKYRKEKYNFWKNLYVVDVRQEHHFRQVFRVAEKLGYEGVNESEHISFGFMKLPEGAISTRKGTAIALDAVLDEAISRARKAIEQKNPDLADKEGIAKAVGIGALKYFDLAHNRKSDIMFDWDTALSFEGNTGPYLQYTYARLRSILRKAGGGVSAKISDAGFDEKERQLLASLLRFPEAITDALAGYMPHMLAGYLFELAQKANEFYHSHPVMQENDEMKKNARLALIAGVATTIKNGLFLLGIESPEEM